MNNRLTVSLRSKWHWISFWLIIVICSLLIGTPGVPVARASEPIEVGYRDFSYPSGTGGNSEASGEKPESKLWWNDGFWWGSLWSTTGNAYHIYRLDLATQDWVDTGTAIDDRNDSRADALWDGQFLYVVSHIFAQNAGAPAPPGERGELYRYSYDVGTKTYSLDAGYPVEVTGGKSETLVIDKDSTGTLWVTYVEDQQVFVNHSLNGDDSTWGTPFVLPGVGNVTSDDISSIVAFDGQIGVMWSDQDSPKTMYFARHQDGASDQNWQSDEVYTASGDDHLNLKSLESDSAGNLFAVIKTSRSSALIVLLVCTSGTDCSSFNNWTSYPVYQSNEFSPTRPILLIDTDNRDLYVFTRNKDNGDGIYYKTTSIDNIQFPSGLGTPFIKSATDLGINDPTSTKQNVNTATGLVVLASDGGPDSYFHNYLDLSGGTNPVITAFTPTSGTEGTPVTITGSNFSGATGVVFSGTSAVFTEVSDSEIQTAVPAGASSGPISVTNASGVGSSTNDFTVESVPQITSFTPIQGSMGTEVTLVGIGFTGATDVFFNGTSAISFTIDFDSQLRAEVPAGASTGPISVTNTVGTGQSTDNFIITLPPIVTAFSPISGVVGTEVTLTGSNFTGASAVTFNGMPASSFTVDSDVQLRADVPAGATTGPIRVTNADGIGFSSEDFTVNAPPAITAFTPNSGPVGTEVTLTGSNFTGATEVAFNGTPASSFTVDSDVQLRTEAPSGATTGRIRVTNTFGTGQSNSDFVVTLPPSSITFTPTDDAQVKSTSPTNNYGSLDTIRLRTGSTIYNSYLKFNVTGVGGAVQSAKLRLYVTDASPDGGSIYLVSNDYLGTSTPWAESGLVWNNAPAISSGSPLSAGGAVNLNTWVEFDVTDAVTGDGIYSFGLNSSSTNSVLYSSKEGANPPELVIETITGPTPVITSFSPSSGPAGTTVTLTGANFTGTTAVAFNGTAAISFTVDSDLQVRAEIPAGASSGPISVTNADGTGVSAASFTVTAAPIISGFSPSSGPVGTEVTVTGSNFTGTTAVAFNGTAAISFTVDSDVQVRAEVPVGATSGPISVTNPDGTGVSGSDFTIGTPPVITGFSPSSGPVGTEVTVTGSNFTGTTAVAFNGTAAISFTVDSDVQVRAEVPVGATSGLISVTNPDGTGVSAASFTVTVLQHTLTVASVGLGTVTLNPPGGVYNAGTVVTLTASPAAGWEFNDWSGDLSGSTNPETITVDADKNVTATFTEQSGGGGPVSHEETQSGGSSSSGSVTTSGNLTGVSGNLYLAAISTRPNIAINVVSGLGLTWIRVDAQCSGRNVTDIEVWQAQGTPSGDGPVTATFSGTPSNAVIVVSRYSGVDTVNPVGNFVSGNTNGANGVCSSGMDTSSYSFDLTTTVDGAVVYGAASMRNKIHTPGAGYTERDEVQQGSGGSVTSVAVEDRMVASASTVAVDGSFSSNVDWAVVGLEIRPGSGGGTAQSTVADSESDSTSKTWRIYLPMITK